MNYRQEYARLVCQVDRAITLLEQCPSAPALRAVQVLLDALLEAEEQYIAAEPAV